MEQRHNDEKNGGEKSTKNHNTNERTKENDHELVQPSHENLTKRVMEIMPAENTIIKHFRTRLCAAAAIECLLTSYAKIEAMPPDEPIALSMLFPTNNDVAVYVTDQDLRCEPGRFESATRCIGKLLGTLRKGMIGIRNMYEIREELASQFHPPRAGFEEVDGLLASFAPALAARSYARIELLNHTDQQPRPYAEWVRISNELPENAELPHVRKRKRKHMNGVTVSPSAALPDADMIDTGGSPIKFEREKVKRRSFRGRARSSTRVHRLVKDDADEYRPPSGTSAPVASFASAPRRRSAFSVPSSHGVRPQRSSTRSRSSLAPSPSPSGHFSEHESSLPHGRHTSRHSHDVFDFSTFHAGAPSPSPSPSSPSLSFIHRTHSKLKHRRFPGSDLYHYPSVCLSAFPADASRAPYFLSNDQFYSIPLPLFASFEHLLPLSVLPKTSLPTTSLPTTETLTTSLPTTLFPTTETPKTLFPTISLPTTETPKTSLPTISLQPPNHTPPPHTHGSSVFFQSMLVRLLRDHVAV